MAETPVLFWLGFAAIITALLAFDLGVIGRQRHAIGIKKALLLTTVDVLVALLFGSAILTTPVLTIRDRQVPRPVARRSRAARAC